MLSLTRRTNESINIGNTIKVTVVGIQGMQVRIGIDAPKDVSVWREEIGQCVKAGMSHADMSDKLQIE